MLHDTLVPDLSTYLFIKISVLILALLILMILAAAPVL